MKRTIMATIMMSGFILPAYAAMDHWDRPSCYIYVHGQCFGNNQNNCSDADYKDMLNECDGYYPSVAVDRPVKPLGLTAKPQSNPRTITTIRKSFKPKAGYTQH